MRLKKYNKFLIDSLLESILVTTADFKRILHKIPSDSKIADFLYAAIDDKKDIKTTYNFIDQSDKNDEISFIPDNQYQRFITKGEDPSTKAKNKSKIGRAVRQILKDNGQEQFSESDIEKFVNQFKSTWDAQAGTGRDIEIVTGENIIKWYNEETYEKASGTLGNSCMRFKAKSNFLKIYAENPNKISLIILTEGGKLKARSLVWKLDDDRIYLDRIYTTDDSDVEFVYNWALKNMVGDDIDKMPSHYKRQVLPIKCSLDKIVFDKYPYMDTMYWMYQGVRDGILTGEGYVSKEYNDRDDYVDYVVHILQNVDGGSDPRNYKFSEHHQKWIHIKNCAYVKSMESYVYREDVVRSKYLSEDFMKDQCVWSEKMDDWVPKDRMIDHFKYGIILRDIIIEIITGYNGAETEPVKIWMDISTNKDKLEIAEDLKRVGTIKAFNPERNPTDYPYYSTDLMVNDWEGEEQVSFLCYKLYQVRVDQRIQDVDFLYLRSSGCWWVTKIDADVFNIPIYETHVKYIPCINYVTIFKNVIHKKFVDQINESDSSASQKSKGIESANSIHEFILTNSYGWVNDYKFSNIMYDKFGEVNTMSIMVDTLKKILIRMDEGNGHWRMGREHGHLSEYIDRAIKMEVGSLDDPAFELIHKYYKSYLLFYSVTCDNYDAKKLLERYIYKSNRPDFEIMSGRVSGYSESAFYLIRVINRYGSDDIISDEMISELRDLAQEMDLGDGRLFANWLPGFISRTSFAEGFSMDDIETVGSLVS